MKVGEIVIYAELNKLIGGDVQGKQRYMLDAARRTVLNEDQMVFEAVHGEGIKRMNDVEILDVGDQSRKRVNRICKRTVKKLACSDPKNLTTEQQLDQYTHMSMFGALALATKPNSFQKLKSAVSVSQERLPLNKTLEAFKT